jgi:isopenicillin-N epimerase
MTAHRHLWRLDEQITFLNHGSFGACPRAVLAEQARLRDELESEPVRFLWREIEGRVDAAREELARFLQADAEDVAFVSNATTAVNAVLRSLELQPGDELLTIDQCYNACKNVLAEVARRSGPEGARAKVVVVPIPFPISGPEVIIERILAAVTPRTRLVLLDHITSPTAIILPVEELVRTLEARGVAVLVDGAHAPGMVPLDLRALGASYYTGNLHKWVCAPKGAAFLHVRRDRQAGLHPATISHGYNTRRSGRSEFQDEFDWQGTLDVTAWLSVPAALQFCAGLLPGGHAALRARNHALVVEARRSLADALGLEVPCPESMLGAMATLPLPEPLHSTLPPAGPDGIISRFDPLQTRLFEHHHIEVPIMRWGTPPRRWFRISAHAHNAPEDYARLVEALRSEVSNLESAIRSPIK